MNFRTCILELKTNDERVFQLKAKDPLLLQNWAQRIQRFLASSRSKSGEYGFFCCGCVICRVRKRMDLFVDTDKVNAEVAPPIVRRRSTQEVVRPTPVGKRDIDISATSLRQKCVPNDN